MTQELQVFLNAGMQREGQKKNTQREREIFERFVGGEGHLLCIWKDSQPVVWGV